MFSNRNPYRWAHYSLYFSELSIAIAMCRENVLGCWPTIYETIRSVLGSKSQDMCARCELQHYDFAIRLLPSIEMSSESLPQFGADSEVNLAVSWHCGRLEESIVRTTLVGNYNDTYLL
jgi:hypothetical protein